MADETSGVEGKLDFLEFVARAETRARSSLGPAANGSSVALALLMRRVNKLMSVDAEQELLPEGLTWASFRVCFALWVLGSLEPHRVALAASMSRAAVSAARKVLEAKGFATTATSETDLRSIVLTLTPEGVEHTEKIYAKHLAITTEWLSPLSAPEQQILLGLLGKIMDSPRAHAYDGVRAVNS